MLAHFNEVTDTVADLEDEATQRLNQGNSWLDHLQGGPPMKPTLKAEGRLKPRPKVIHVSPKQRRVTNGG